MAQPKFKIFLSYARADSSSADRIVSALESRGLTVRLDKRDLPYGEKWQNELAGFIKSADAVVFLVSGRSVRSQWCKWELAQVASQSKRLVPVVVESVPPEALPPEIGEVHLFPFTPGLDFASRADELARILMTDRLWVQEHTRLADLANQWTFHQRSSDRLLRGQALSSAEQWMTRRTDGAPAPSQEHLAFIAASQIAGKRRWRAWVGGMTAVTVGALLLAGLALVQRREAVRQTGIAQTNEAEALTQKNNAERQRALAEKNEKNAREQRDRALVTQSTFLADLSQQKFKIHDNVAATLLAIEALPDQRSGVVRPVVAEAQLSLDQAWRGQHEQSAPQEGKVLSGHTAWVFSCALSPDGRRAVTGSADETARFWDLEEGTASVVLGGHAGKVNYVAFSGDGKKIVTVASDGLRLWDAETGNALRHINRAFKRWVRLSANQDGTRVLTASEDNVIQLWDVENGVELSSLKREGVLEVRLDETGAWALVAQTDSVELQNAKDGSQVRVLRDLPKPTRGAAFSPDGSLIITLSDDATARVWDRNDGKLVASVTGTIVGFDRGYREFGGALITGDGKKALAETENGYLIFEVDTGKKLGVLQISDGEKRTVRWSPDGRFIVTASVTEGDSAAPTSAQFWDGETGKLISTLDHDSEVACADYSQDGSKILTTAADNNVRIWNVVSGNDDFGGQMIARLQGDESDITKAVFSKDSRLLLTIAKDFTARVWDAETGKPKSTLKGHEGEISRGFFSERDSNRIITRSKDSTARVWDAETGREVAVLSGHSGPIWGIDEDPKNQRLLTAADDNSVRIWKTESGEQIKTREFRPAQVRAITANLSLLRAIVLTEGSLLELWDVENNTRIAELVGHSGEPEFETMDGDPPVYLASEDRVIRCWEVGNGKLLSEIKNRGDVRRFELSYDGRRLLLEHGSRQYDQPAVFELWDVVSGKRVSQFEGDVRPTVFGLSPDGSRLFTSSIDTNSFYDTLTGSRLTLEFSRRTQNIVYSDDGKVMAISPQDDIRIVDTAGGATITSLTKTKPDDYVQALAISPDRSRLVSVLGKSAALWRLAPTPQNLVDYAKSSVPRCFNPEQRKKYFLPVEPPRWCITGVGNEQEEDPKKWHPKPPYQTDEWKDWLTARDRGENPIIPKGS